jgi:hypothetical protein
MDDNAAGGSPASAGGADQGRQMLEQAMGKIRDFKQQIDAFGSDYPAVAPEVKQLQQILKRMIVKVAQQAPQQTASSSNLPMGG